MCRRAPTSAVAISHSTKSAPSVGRAVGLSCMVKTGWPASRESVERDVLIVAARAGAQVDEQAIVAIGGGVAERLPGHR